MKPLRPVQAIPSTPVTMTAEEAAFLARYRTLSPDANRVLMSIFNSLHEHCEKEVRKARPVLRLMQGGRP